MRFKICCIKSVHEAEMAIAAGAWAIGLVAQMPSGPGPISDDEIRNIAAATKGRAQRFLLTSRTDPEAIIAHIRYCGTDVVQLVDAVPTHTYAAVRKACPGVHIAQVVHVQDELAIAQAHAAAQYCDMVLLDSGKPDAAIKTFGGTGEVHDWALSARIVRELEVPVILAGGLNPQNAAKACRIVGPFALDVCSGLRGPDYVLQADKLTAFAGAIVG